MRQSGQAQEPKSDAKKECKSVFEIPFGLLKLISWLMLKPFFGFEVRGLQHLQACRNGVILAGNHTGFLDSLTVLVGCARYFRFMMTEEVFSWGLIGKLVPFGNIIPLYKGREKRALVDAVQLLKQGGALCIFPEGKLTKDGCLNPFHEGVAYLQEKSGAAIVPFAIHGGFEAWPQARRLPVFRKVILEFGEPMTSPAPLVNAAAVTHSANRAKVVKALEYRVLALKAALDDAAESLPEVASLPRVAPGQGDWIGN